MLTVGWLGALSAGSIAHANSYQTALAATVEIPLNSEVMLPLQQKATQLRTPLEIYRYVRDRYQFNLYHGSRSNAANTFHSSGANDVDLATLLIAMMRSQGIPARYVRGDVVLEKYNLANWLKAQRDDAPNMLATSRWSVSNGDQYVEFEHAWVQVFVPKNSLTGIEPGVNCVQTPDACEWVDLDPSYKLHSAPKSTLQMLELLDFDYSAYYHAQRNNDHRQTNQNPVTVFEQQVQDYLATNHPGTSLADLLNTGRIQNLVCSHGLPYSLPFSQVANTRQYHSVAEHDATEGKGWNRYIHLSMDKIVWSSDSNRWDRTNIFQNYKVLRSEISTHPLRLEFESCGGNCMQTQVLIGDSVRYTVNSSQIQWGDRISVHVGAESVPEFADQREYSGVVGGQYVIGVNDHTTNWMQVQRASNQLNKTKTQYKVKRDPQGELYVDSNNNNQREDYELDLSLATAVKKAVTRDFLELATRLYFFQVENSTKRLESMARVNHLLRTGFGMVGPVYRDGGALDALQPGGLLIDMLFIFEPWYRSGTRPPVEKEYADLFMHMSSYFEHQTLESLTGYDAISTMSGLQRALAGGGELVVLDSQQGDAGLQSAYEKMGFSSHPTHVAERNWDLFGSRPVTWQPRHSSALVEMELVKKNVDYSTPPQRRYSWRYTSALQNTMESYASRLDTLNVLLGQHGGSCILPVPGLNIGGQWHSGDCNHVKNLLQADFNATINNEYYAFFDRNAKSLNGNHGFSPGDYVYRAFPKSRDAHTVAFVEHLRDNIKVPHDAALLNYVPDNPKVTMTFASKRTLGRHYDAAVYINDTINASTNRWVYSNYVIRNQTFHAGGGHGIADNPTGPPPPLIPPASGYEARLIEDYPYAALELQSGWNQIPANYLQAAHPPHALAALTPESGTLVIAQVVDQQIKIWSSSDAVDTLNRYSRTVFDPLDFIDPSRSLWIALWGEATPLPLSWLEPNGSTASSNQRVLAPHSCEPISYDNAPGFAPPPVQLNPSAVTRTPQTLGNGDKRVTLMAGWNLVKNEFPNLLNPNSISVELYNPPILGLYFWQLHSNQWKGWASVAPNARVGSYPALNSLSPGLDFWVYLPKNYNNLSFTVDLPDLPTYTVPPVGQDWEPLIRNPLVNTENSTLQITLHSGWNVVQNVMTGDLSVAALYGAILSSGGSQVSNLELWQNQNGTWHGWNAADPSGHHSGGTPTLSTVNPDADIWIHVPSSAGNLTLTLGQPGEPTHVDRSIQSNAKAVVADASVDGPSGVGAGSHTINPDGSFSYTLPLKIIPGTGAAPNLSLVYNSNGPNGILGMGWSISGIPIITRMNYGQGIRYDNNQDTFVGPSGRLIPHADLGNGEVEYRSEQETWSKFIRMNSGNSTYWIAVQPDGSQMYFGFVADARIHASDRTGNPVRVWALNQFKDAYGNAYHVTYFQDEGSFYPDKITYTSGNGLSSTREVRFIREERPDQWISYDQGTKVVTRHRIKAIEIFGWDNGNPKLVRKYMLQYHHDVGPNLSFLERVIDGGDTGDVNSPLRHEFSWQRQTVEGDSVNNAMFSHAIEMPFQTPYTTNQKIWYFSADFNGDGKTDLLEAVSGGINHVYFFDTSSNRFVKNETWSQSLQGIPLQSYEAELVKASAYHRLHLGDFNGDGRVDLLRTANDVAGDKNRFLFATDHGFTSVGTWDDRLQVHENEMFLWIYIGDFNGDGKSDILRTGVKYDGEFKETSILYGKSTGNDLSFTLGCIPFEFYGPFYDNDTKSKHFPHLGDFNGDGKTDVFLSGIAGGQNQLWGFTEEHSHGLGCTSDFQSLPLGALALSPELHHHGNKQRILVTDFNGDGKADILRTRNFSADGPNQLWLSTGMGFSENVLPDPMLHSPLEYVLDGDYSQRLYPSDFNGDGKADLLQVTAQGLGQDTLLLSRGSGDFHNAIMDQIPDGSLQRDASGPFHLVMGDFNGDGKTDLLRVRNYKSPNKTHAILRETNDLLPQSSNNQTSQLWLNQHQPANYRVHIVNTDLGGSLRVYYRPATHAETGQPIQRVSTCHNGGDPAPDCGVPLASARLLVTGVVQNRNRSASYSTETLTTQYKYYNGRVIRGPIPDRRNLGFETTEVTEMDSRTTVKTSYWQRSDFFGVPHVVDTYVHDQISSRIETQYQRFYPHGGDQIKLVKPTHVTTTTYDPEKTDGNWDHRRITENARQTTYDTASNGYYFPVKVLECINGNCKTVLTEYRHYPNEWILGRTLDVKTLNGDVPIGQGTNRDKLAWTQYQYDESVPQYPLQRTEQCKHPQGRCDQNGHQWISIQQGLKYDAHGNLIESRDRYGHLVQFFYDDTYRTFVKEERRYLGTDTSVSYLSQHKTYDAAGRQKSATDANNVTVYFDYDAWGRTTKVHRGSNAHVAYSYHNDGQAPTQYNRMEVISESGASLDIQEVYFDGFGFIYREKSKSDQGMLQVENRSDFVNGLQVKRRSKPCYCDNPAQWSRTEYDFAGRVKQVFQYQDTSEPFAEYAYGSQFGEHWVQRFNTVMGNRVSQTEHHDVFGNLVKSVDAHNQLTHYRYDDSNRLVEVELPNGETTTMVYDGLGRRTSITEPHTGTTSFAFDDIVSRKTRTTARGSITYAYDALGRLVSQVAGDGSFTYQYVYDQSPQQDDYHNSKGRLSSVSFPGGTYAYSYDTLGQMIRKTTQLQDLYNTPYIQTWAYDDFGRVAHTVLPDGSKVDYGFTLGSHLDTVHLNGSQRVRFNNYNDLGQVLEKTVYGENNQWVQTLYAYNSDDRLAQLQTQSVHGTELQNLHYDYDRSGNIKNMTDQRGNKIIQGIDTSATQRFEYDALSRMTFAEGSYRDSSNHQPHHNTYSYDAIGNLTKMRRKTFSFSGNTPSRLSHVNGQRVDGSAYNVNVHFDSSGNVTIKQGNGANWYYSYDLDNRLTEARNTTSGEVVSFEYDHAGQRIKKVFQRSDGSQVATWYVDKTFERRRDSKQNEDLITLYVYGNGQKLFSQTRYRERSTQRLTGNTTSSLPIGMFFYHSDHLGSSTLVTDSAGKERTRLSYLPFGQLDRDHSVGLDSVTHKFTSQELDEETGLYYYNARYYDPEIGRFLTADSIVPNPGNGQAFNRYAYVYNNPLFYTDPSGHDPITAAVVGAMVSAIITAAQGGSPQQILTSAFLGAVSGATFYGVGQALHVAGAGIGMKIVTHAMVGGFLGGFNSAVTGGDVQKGAMTGAFSAGFSKFATVGNFPIGEFTVGGFAASVAVGGTSGGLVSYLFYGESFEDGFVEGAKTAAIAYAFNQSARKMRAQKRAELQKKAMAAKCAKYPSSLGCSGYKNRLEKLHNRPVAPLSKTASVAVGIIGVGASGVSIFTTGPLGVWATYVGYGATALSVADALAQGDPLEAGVQAAPTLAGKVLTKGGLPNIGNAVDLGGTTVNAVRGIPTAE